MKEIAVIGDVHGKVNEYWKILQCLQKETNSIQVGDFGFKKQHKWHKENIDSDLHKVNFGNHDDYTFLNHTHSLGNFTIKENLMTVRGAWSVDNRLRTEGIDWWSNEQLNYEEMQQAIDLYIKHKPKIMITHDCPQEVKQSLFDYDNKTITNNGLQSMFEEHQPDVWIFGHYHRSKNEIINGTRFICLAELEMIII